jgi:hypothetical protein
MRRLLANLVLLVSLWGYLAPALLSAAELDLPPCCRGRGKHHCSMMAAVRNTDGSPGFRIHNPPCPQRAQCVLTTSAVVALASQAVSPATPHVEAIQHAESAARGSRRPVLRQGRSPPSLSL